MMEYLNREHAIFRQKPMLYELAVRFSLQQALRIASSFRLQFDSERLSRVLHSDEMALLGGSIGHEQTRYAKGLTVTEAQLDADRVREIQRLLSFELEGREDLALNYVQSLTLMDERKMVVFHSTDTNDAVLVNFPDAERDRLVQTFRESEIPDGVLEQVDVDPAKLLRS